MSICLAFLDNTHHFPKVAPPGSPFWRQQAPSRKDSASQPRFSHHLPCISAFHSSQISRFVVFWSLELPIKFMPRPQSPSGCMPGTVLTQRAQQSTPGAHSGEASKQSAIEDILWSVPGQTYVPRATVPTRTPSLHQCDRECGWPQESSILSPCANTPVWTARPPCMWTRLNRFLLHPQDPD